MVSNPNASPENVQCLFWLRYLAASGVEIVLPEIADYEVRRELIRARKTSGIRRLDALRNEPSVSYLPLTTGTMLRPAELWARARQQGRSTADPKALDCDVILADQAQLAAEGGRNIIVATTNVDHLRLFVSAAEWHEIPTS